jgi:hypothetical protein
MHQSHGGRKSSCQPRCPQAWQMTSGSDGANDSQHPLTLPELHLGQREPRISGNG